MPTIHKCKGSNLHNLATQEAWAMPVIGGEIQHEHLTFPAHHDLHALSHVIFHCFGNGSQSVALLGFNDSLKGYHFVSDLQTSDRRRGLCRYGLHF
mmetsp:Transcript_43815/g.71168  ORF Transcript_43815/g.71168 Transcript_43815/m.71168 type:complete len:96 (-) Transcript_43815:474-761(-)